MKYLFDVKFLFILTPNENRIPNPKESDLRQKGEITHVSYK